MKKFVTGFLMLLLATSLLLAGCGGSKSSTESTGQNTAPSASTDDSWKKVQEKGEFVLGLDESFPPMGFKDEKGNIVGFDIDIAQEVFKRLGVKLKLQPINWDAKVQELDTGNIDCIWNGFTINDERKQNVLFTSPYMKNRQVIVVMSTSPYKTLADLTGKKLGLQAGSSAADALDKSADFKGKLKQVVPFDDNMTALLDLEKGGLDAVLMDEIVARYYITMKNKGYTVLDEALASEEYGVGFRKNDQELMKKVQETMEAMAKDGKMAEISNKWFKKDITTIGK
ncbi:MAG TPA: amino acid ABC transporter substrate-binding protein [Bacillota bacterium]|nr:amino acid ABC transporter substrate-binding protein [Bacillota bacterium]